MTESKLILWIGTKTRRFIKCDGRAKASLTQTWFSMLSCTKCMKWWDSFPWVIFSSAAVKVTALLTLPAAVTNVSARMAAAVLCRAARWEALLNSRAVSTSGRITRCSERQVAVFYHPFRAFLRMSKQSTLALFDTELFSTEIKRRLTVKNKKESQHEIHCVRRLLKTLFLFL